MKKEKKLYQIKNTNNKLKEKIFTTVMTIFLIISLLFLVLNFAINIILAIPNISLKLISILKKVSTFLSFFTLGSMFLNALLLLICIPKENKKNNEYDNYVLVSKEEYNTWQKNKK